MKTILICHQGANLDREGLGRWLASFSELTGIIVLQEKKEQLWQRSKKEWKRIGGYRRLDTLSLLIHQRPENERVAILDK